MIDTKFDIAVKFDQFSEQWRPKVVAELNGQEMKLVKCLGSFPWHTHESQDELFLVWRGVFRIEFRDTAIKLRSGEAFVVRRGVEHRTVSDEESEVIIFEPTGTRNTGEVSDSVYTAPNGIRL